MHRAFICVFMLMILFVVGCETTTVMAADLVLQNPTMSKADQILSFAKAFAEIVGQVSNTSYGNLLWWLLLWQFMVKDLLIGIVITVTLAELFYIFYRLVRS